MRLLLCAALMIAWCLTCHAATDETLTTAREELFGYLEKVYSKKWLSGTVVSLEVEDSLDEEMFRVVSGNRSISITGGSGRGVLYGVYDFLQRGLGVRWYTKDLTVVPKMEKGVLPVMDYSGAPAFPMRWVMFSQSGNDEAWCAHNRLNMGWNYTQNRFGGLTAWRGGHSAFSYVSPRKYYDKHPEYFSLRDSVVNGDTIKVRIPDGQLCLSNPDVMALCKEHLMKMVEEYPDDWIYDFSQMDNNRYCQCDGCMSIAKRYGAQSGVVVWFVNQLADTLAEEHPSKMLGTMAYWYTMYPPCGIKPRENVVIRLCNLYTCLAHGPSAKECESMMRYRGNLLMWNRLTKRIFVWDYAANFENYILPYPNIQARAECLRLWKWYGVSGVMEQGMYEQGWGDFSEMKQWVLAQLLWNPEQDVIQLCHEFIEAWYGNAADEVWEYFRITQELVGERTFFRAFVWQFHSMYTATYMTRSRDLLEAAMMKAAGNSETEQRVRRLIIGIDYLYVNRNILLASVNGRYARLKGMLSEDPTVIKEGGIYFESLMEELHERAVEKIEILLCNVVGWVLAGLMIYRINKKYAKAKHNNTSI